MYRWPADPVHFKKHYTERHLALCRAIPGLAHSRYAFEPVALEGPERWFCVFEAEFEDEATMNALLETPEARAAAADVANFSPEPPTSLVYTLNPV